MCHIMAFRLVLCKGTVETYKYFDQNVLRVCSFALRTTRILACATKLTCTPQRDAYLETVKSESLTRTHERGGEAPRENAREPR